MIPMTNSVYFRDKAYIFGGRHNEVRYSYIFVYIVVSLFCLKPKDSGMAGLN